MTERWHAYPVIPTLIPRIGDFINFPRGCGNDWWDAPCTATWSAAPDLNRYLKNDLGYKSHNMPEVVQAYRDNPLPPNMANAPIPIQPGDVVFYRNLDELEAEFSHTALVIGWGPPTFFQNEGEVPKCSADLPGDWSDAFDPESNRLPWIIDHRRQPFKRAFNDTGGTHEIEFVHIPDFLGEW